MLPRTPLYGSYLPRTVHAKVVICTLQRLKALLIAYEKWTKFVRSKTSRQKILFRSFLRRVFQKFEYSLPDALTCELYSTFNVSRTENIQCIFLHHFLLQDIHARNSWENYTSGTGLYVQIPQTFPRYVRIRLNSKR